MRSTTSRIYLERPSARRERDYLDAGHRSRALHRGLVTPATNPCEFREYLRMARRPTQDSFFVVAAATGDLAGVVDIKDITSGHASFGRIGYYAFVPYAATGLMREGLLRAIDAAFRDLKLSRIEAKIQPANCRSLRLAQSLGFKRDEHGCGYQKIGARWLDHGLWVLTRGDWPEPAERFYARA